MLLIVPLGGLVAVLAWLAFSSSSTTSAETCFEPREVREVFLGKSCTGYKSVVDHYVHKSNKVSYQKRVCVEPPRCRTYKLVWTSFQQEIDIPVYKSVPNCTPVIYYKPVIKKVQVACATPCQNECSLNQCWSGTETRECGLFDNDKCLEWGPNINNCASASRGASGQCINGSCVVPKPDSGFSGVAKGPPREGCVNIGVGYNSGNSKFITVTQGTSFVVQWNVDINACTTKPTECVGQGGLNRVDLSTKGGSQSQSGFTGTAPANYNNGNHDYGITCYFPTEGGGLVSRSDKATVKYNLDLSKPATCQNNECSPGQCWNSSQTRSCVKDSVTGKYCWQGNPLSCVPGTHCGQGGQCVDDKTGEPRTPATDGTDGAGTDGAGTGGTGGAGGDGGAGFPAFGSTQCYDGKDNDNDKKIDSADPGCLDSSGKYNPNDNSEFNYKLREIIPDFFNLNWFKVNVADLFKVEAFGKE